MISYVAGAPHVHIHNPTSHPKRQVLLSQDQWSQLMTHADDLIDGLQNLHEGVDITFNLGQNLYAGVTTPYSVANIRYWYDFEGTLKPRAEGMTLHLDKLEHLVHIRHLIELAF